MKRLKLITVLLALLLAAMVMVPIVSAADNFQSLSNDKELIESNYIPVELAREHATITMLIMIQSGALDSNWVGAKINPTPKEIYDVNGERLFYLFSVEKKGERVGEIYVAASKVLGGSVIAIGSINEPDTFEKMQKFSQKVIKEKYPGYQIIYEKTVSFDFPVLGSMITLKNEKTGESKNVIIDSRDGSEKKMDTQVSSYFDQIPVEVKKQNIAIWEQQSAVNEELKNNLLSENPELLQNYSEMDISQLTQSITKAKTSSVQSKALLLDDGMRIISGLTHYTQYFSDWCGVATGQIISSKHMTPPWSQYHIADMMQAYNYSTNPPTPSGTTINKELAYYRPSVDDGGLGKGNSYSPSEDATWDAARNEIEYYRIPLKIGRVQPTAHARACNGWMAEGGNRYLLFYDPASYGSIYWEYVSPGFTYNNFIYVR